MNIVVMLAQSRPVFAELVALVAIETLDARRAHSHCIVLPDVAMSHRHDRCDAQGENGRRQIITHTQGLITGAILKPYLKRFKHNAKLIRQGLYVRLVMPRPRDLHEASKVTVTSHDPHASMTAARADLTHVL